MSVFTWWLLVLINYMSKDREDFLNLQMTCKLENMTQMYESDKQKALKRLKIGWKQIMLNVVRENAVLYLVLEKKKIIVQEQDF